MDLETNVEVLTSEEVGPVPSLIQAYIELCKMVCLLVRREDATQGWASAQSLERLSRDSTDEGSCGDLGKFRENSHFMRFGSP